MLDHLRQDLQATLDEILTAGLHKPERVISTPHRSYSFRIRLLHPRAALTAAQVSPALL